MTKIKLRGLKLLEKGAQVVSSCPAGENVLAPGICSPLALNKINITFLTHLCPSEGTGFTNALCTDGTAGRAAASLIESQQKWSGGLKVNQDISILSVFTHDQRPQVAGTLLEAMASKKVALWGLASSPSALSLVVSSADTEEAINCFFDAFDFPSYSSPSDWYAAYEGKEHLLRKIIASYQEKVIKIYDIIQKPDLDLWGLTLPVSNLGDLGAALKTLDGLGFRMPFVTAHPHRLEPHLRFAFCFAGSQGVEVEHSFSRHLGKAEIERHSKVAGLFIHGPHFGDRYGIVHTMAEALHHAGVLLLAINCSVSSISAVVRGSDLEMALQTLHRTFERS